MIVGALELPPLHITQRNMPKTIDINKEKSNKKIIRIEDKFVKKDKKEFKNLLNLSEKAARKNIIHPKKHTHSHILDISRPKKEKEEKIYHIPEEKDTSFFPGYKKELFRLASIGVTIMILINTINVYNIAQHKKEQAITSAYQGFQNIMEGSVNIANYDINQANLSFDEALYNFQIAKQTLWFIESNSIFNKGTSSAVAQNLIDSGVKLAEAGTLFTQAITNLSQIINEFDNINSKDSLTEEIKKDFLPLIEQSLTNLEEVQKNLEEMNTNKLPEDLRPKFELAKQKIGDLLDFAYLLKNYVPSFLELIGDTHPQRFLILLQNSDEIRPTGGFIGMYAIMDINEGKLTKLDVRDIYDSDGLLHEEIPAPEEIQSLSNNWRMRDSNYSPDFPISAKKAAWFLEKEKGPGVDSIIAIDLNFAADLLELVGPIQIDGLKKPLTKDNFKTILSYIVESKLTGKSTPKKILQKFIPQVERQLAEKKPWPNLVSILQKNIKEKHLLAYSKDEDIQNLFEYLGADGKMAENAEKQDYLGVFHTSVGGNKTDAWIEQQITHKTFLDKNGQIINKVTILRRHTWNKEKEIELENLIRSSGFDQEISGRVKDILGRSPNIVKTRVYVPFGSVLEEVTGIDRKNVKTKIDEELGKTYFSLKISVYPENETKIILKYHLPFRMKFETNPVFRLGSEVADTYNFYIQKQPGTVADTFYKEVFLNGQVKGYSSYPTNFNEIETGRFMYQTELREDQYVSLLVGVE